MGNMVSPSRAVSLCTRSLGSLLSQPQPWAHRVGVGPAARRPALQRGPPRTQEASFLGRGGGGQLCVVGGGTGLQETQTHLYFVLAGHHECLEILISWGVDVDQDIPHLGTPLYVACMSQQFHCVRKLLYAGNFLYPIFHSVCTHKQFFSFVLTSLNKLL